MGPAVFRVVLAFGALVALLVSIAFAWAGGYEIARGTRVPGFAGYGFFPRNGIRRADSWSPQKWRENGLQITVMAVGFLILAAWLAVAALDV